MSTATATAPVNTYDAVTLAMENNADQSFTAKRLVTVVGKSRTSVNDSLRKLSEAGVVIRFDKDGVVLWSLTPTRKAALKRAAAKAAKAAAPTTPKASARATTTAKKGNTVTDTADSTPTRTDTGRRIKGAIDHEIRTWFEANDNTPAGSYAVSKGIESSAGAAYVALRRMDKEGKATLVSTEPDRYSINFDADGWNVTAE